MIIPKISHSCNELGAYLKEKGSLVQSTHTEGAFVKTAYMAASLCIRFLGLLALAAEGALTLGAALVCIPVGIAIDPARSITSISCYIQKIQKILFFPASVLLQQIPMVATSLLEGSHRSAEELAQGWIYR